METRYQLYSPAEEIHTVRKVELILLTRSYGWKMTRIARSSTRKWTRIARSLTGKWTSLPVDY